MPRRTRKFTETPESQALDATVREYTKVEKRLLELREQLHRDITAAVNAGMSKSEAGRRSGYTREYVHRLVTEAEKPDS